MMLIAIWGSGGDPSEQEPMTLKWEDGTNATAEDFRQAKKGSVQQLEGPDGTLRRHYFMTKPARVYYDRARKDWMIAGESIGPTALEVYDPEAKDDALFEAAMDRDVLHDIRILR